MSELCGYDACDQHPTVTFDNGARMCAFHGLMALLVGGRGVGLAPEEVAEALQEAWVEGRAPGAVTMAMERLLGAPNVHPEPFGTPSRTTFERIVFRRVRHG